MKNLTLLFLFFAIFNYSSCSLAKNIYSFPDLSNTNEMFDTFMIDFRGVKTPLSTFWSLCNWQMDLTEFKKTHSNVKGGEGRAGFQYIDNTKSVILSLYDIFYTENDQEKTMNAELVYPSGESKSFENSGSGMNYLYEFSWEENKWYRLVIKSWKDYETGKTFVGEWVEDIDNEKWELISYFNTNLENSYIIGTLSQFQENYDEKYFGLERSFNIKNIYAYDIEDKEWKSLATSKIYYDPASKKLNTAGTHEIGFTDEYFYGSSGLPVDDQKDYDATNPIYVKGAIKQKSQPEFQEVSLSIKAFATLKKYLNVSWSISKKGSPAYSFKVTIKQNDKDVHTYQTTRPEESSYKYTGNFFGIYKVTVEAVGIFGQTVSKTVDVMA